MTEHVVEHFNCRCHSDEHTLKFTLSQYSDSDVDLWTSIYLFQPQSFLKRIWLALKYVFGSHCGEGHWDCVMLNVEDADRLIALLQKYKELSNSKPQTKETGPAFNFTGTIPPD